MENKEKQRKEIEYYLVSMRNVLSLRTKLKQLYFQNVNQTMPLEHMPV